MLFYVLPLVLFPLSPIQQRVESSLPHILLTTLTRVARLIGVRRALQPAGCARQLGGNRKAPAYMAFELVRTSL